MKKMVSKRGQQFSTTTLLIIILGVLALIVIAVGFTQGWDYFGTLFGFAPDDLNSAAVACASYADSDALALSYCQYRELTIDSQKQWVNCNDIRIKAIAVLGADNVDFDAQTCGNQSKYCANVLQNKIGYDGKDYVNGIVCAKAQ